VERLGGRVPAPAGWDLGCLHAFGGDPAAVAAAQAGYGEGLPGDALDAFTDARRFQATAWTAVIAREHPDARGRAAARIAFYRGRAPSEQPPGPV
jgi:hypothetical protein